MKNFRIGQHEYTCKGDGTLASDLADKGYRGRVYLSKQGQLYAIIAIDNKKNQSFIRGPIFGEDGKPNHLEDKLASHLSDQSVQLVRADSHIPLFSQDVKRLLQQVYPTFG